MEDLILNGIFYGQQNQALKTSRMSQVHGQFREKYFANPIYKTFIYLDMHSFLAGQIKSSNLTPADEVNLFKRRIILQNYLNSIQIYKPLFKTTKQSYSEKVYNQQFKGSLSVVRHFNSIKLNENIHQNDSNKMKQKVLKFDQPKYNEFPNENQIMLHEELNPNEFERLPEPNLSNNKNKYNPEKSIPGEYLTLNNTTPLYIGWDGLLRKFLVKTPNIPDNFKSGDFFTKTKSNESLPPYFTFQTWISDLNEQINNGNKTLQLPSVNLSSKELSHLKEALEFEFDDQSAQNLTKNVNEALKDKTLNTLLDRFPNYDWHWKKKKLDFKFKKYLDLGDASPPKLDGIAWPGVRDANLMQKLLESSKR